VRDGWTQTLVVLASRMAPQTALLPVREKHSLRQIKRKNLQDSRQPAG